MEATQKKIELVAPDRGNYLDHGWVATKGFFNTVEAATCPVTASTRLALDINTRISGLRIRKQDIVS